MSSFMDRSAPSQLRRNGNLSPIRPREKMPTVYRHRMSPSREQLHAEGVRWPRDNSYLRKRLDRDIEIKDRVFSKPFSLTSHDNPEWMTLHQHHYRRDHFHHAPRGSQIGSQIQQLHYDVFNNPKTHFPGRNEGHYFLNMKEEGAQSPKGQQESLRKTFTHFLAFQPQVTAKVGSNSFRDYSIPKPQLKVGSQSFVDTYSPF